MPALTPIYNRYAERLQQTLADTEWSSVARLAQAIVSCRDRGRRIFLCGNGGSAANAMHIANDLIYAPKGKGVKATALSANSAILTCVANDIDYNEIFSHQLATQGEEGDLLIALSGSGNSENIVRAIDQAHALSMNSCAILGFDGGRCKPLAKMVIHFPVEDMQVSEDLQVIVGHMLMKTIAP